jgi:hypothetical protein
MNSVTSIDIVDDHRMAMEQSAPVVAVTSPKGSATGTQKSNESFQVTYDLYASFWKLQSYFASSVKPFEPLSAWNDFLGLAKKTIEMFEKSSSVDLNSAQKSSQKQHSSNNNNNGDEQYQGNKYLTSSQLFALQINDPLLRQQFSVQLWIFAHYLQ